MHNLVMPLSRCNLLLLALFLCAPARGSLAGPGPGAKGKQPPVLAKLLAAGASLQKDEALAVVKSAVDQWDIPLRLKPPAVQRLDRAILAYFDQDEGQGLSATDLSYLADVEKTKVEWRLAETSFLPEDRAKIPELAAHMKTALLALERSNELLKNVYAGGGSGHNDGPHGPPPGPPQPGPTPWPSPGNAGLHCRGDNWSPRCVKQEIAEGRLEDALSDINAHLALNPNDTAALDLRAKLYAEAGLLTLARADAQKALSLDPKDRAAFALSKLSESQTSSRVADKLPTQVNFTGEAMAKPSLPVPAPNAVFAAASDRQELSDAVRDLNSSMAASALRAAAAAMGTGNMPAAMPELDRALQADPLNPGAWRLRAIANAQQGFHVAALRDCEAGLRLAPKDTGLLITESFAKNRLGDFPGALDAAQRARDIDPDSVDALANYAYAWGGLGDRSRMLSLLEEAAGKDPRYASSLESARGAAAGSDILFLFPGEAQAAGAESSGAQTPARRGGLSSPVFNGLVCLLIAALVGVEIAHRKRERRRLLQAQSQPVRRVVGVGKV